MIYKIPVTAAEFCYLTRAVKRDLEQLEEMAPWDIDDNQDEHASEIRLCKSMTELLGGVEQAKAITN